MRQSKRHEGKIIVAAGHDGKLSRIGRLESQPSYFAARIEKTRRAGFPACHRPNSLGPTPIIKQNTP